MKQRLTLGKESRKSPPQSATEHGTRKHNLNVSASQNIPSLNPKKQQSDPKFRNNYIRFNQASESREDILSPGSQRSLDLDDDPSEFAARNRGKFTQRTDISQGVGQPEVQDVEEEEKQEPPQPQRLSAISHSQSVNTFHERKVSTQSTKARKEQIYRAVDPNGNIIGATKNDGISPQRMIKCTDYRQEGAPPTPTTSKLKSLQKTAVASKKGGFPGVSATYQSATNNLNESKASIAASDRQTMATSPSKKQYAPLLSKPSLESKHTLGRRTNNNVSPMKSPTKRASQMAAKQPVQNAYPKNNFVSKKESIATRQSEMTFQPDEMDRDFQGDKDAEIANLKGIIKALNLKITITKDLERELENIRNEQVKNEDNRGQLRQKIEGSSHKLIENQKKSEKFQQLVVEENQNFNEIILEKDQVIFDKDKEIQELQALLKQQEKVNKEQALKMADLHSVKAQNERLQNDLARANEQRKQTQQDFKKAQEKNDEMLQKEYQQREKLVKEKQQMQQQAIELQSIINELEIKNNKQDHEIGKRDNEITRLKQKLQLLDEMEQHRDQLQDQIRQEQNERADLTRQINQLKDETEKLRLEDEEQSAKLREDLENERVEKLDLQGQCGEKDSKIKSLMMTNLELQAELDARVQVYEVKEDLEQQLEEVNEYVEQQKVAKSEIQRELDNAGDYIIEQEEKVNKANQTALELLNQLKEADKEIEELKKKVTQLQGMTQQYVPFKGDPIDEALANFLNNFHDKGKLQVMFIRLQPGVYSFGSKKVCIRVLDGKINIRVGGGYLRITEFLEKYTTEELEKSIRNNIDPTGGDASPIKRPGSPKKLLKQINKMDQLMPTNVKPLPGAPPERGNSPSPNR